MQISKLRHPNESLALVISILSLVGFILLGTILLPLSIISVYGLCLWASRRWFVNQNQWIQADKKEILSEFLSEKGQKLGLNSIPQIAVIEPNNWAHRISMFLLKGEYLFLPKQDEATLDASKELNATLTWRLSVQLSQIALGHTAIWRKVLTFPSLLIPFVSSFLLKTENSSVDRVQRYLHQDLPDTLPKKLPYKGKGSGIAMRVLTDAWQESLLNWLTQKIGFAWNGETSPEQRRHQVEHFNPETIFAAGPTQLSESSSTQETSDYIMQSTNPSSRKRINPRMAGLIGFLAGIPLSYLFQNGLVRNKLSLGDYIAKLPDIIGAAGDRNDMAGIVVTLVVTCVIFAIVGFGVSKYLNNRHAG